MSDPVFWIGLVSVGCMLLSATAFQALRRYSRAQLKHHLVRRGRSEWMERLVERRTSLILTSAVINAVSVVVMVLMLAHLLEPSDAGAGWWRDVWIFVISFGLLLLLGLAIPFVAAKHAGEAFLARALPALGGLSLVLFPVVRVLSALDWAAERLAGSRENGNGSAAGQAGLEILSVVSESEKQGLVDEKERDMIESVIQFHERDVEEIMTPRTDIKGLPSDAGIEDVKALIRTAGHSRFPIYAESIDQILGVLYVKDLLVRNSDEPVDLKKIVRKVPFVPESKPLRELLTQFQEEQVHLAIVVDEYGGTAGLVTIEDVLEELVGEITDEHDRVVPAPIQRIDEDTVEVEARVHIEDLGEALDVPIPKNEDYETVGGFVFATLGKIPKTGEEFNHKNLHVRVLDAEERKVNRLRIHVTREPRDET